MFRSRVTQNKQDIEVKRVGARKTVVKTKNKNKTKTKRTITTKKNKGKSNKKSE